MVDGVNGVSVYGCGKAGFTPPFGLYYTQKSNILYTCAVILPIGDIILPQLKDKVEKVCSAMGGIAFGMMISVSGTGGCAVEMFLKSS